MHSIQRSCKMGRLLYAIIFTLLITLFDTVQADNTFTYLDDGNECKNVKTSLEAIANNEKANLQTMKSWIDNFNTAIQQLTGRITQLQNDIEDLSKRSCTVQQGALNAKCEI
ncbi:uncharacterized protein [Eurosta solidaginis]|uniref:uncharacterized protein isoform X2 n=1 Tax=Eurosta solidaginis TaxID=178769 RepID=UPI003530908E